MYRNLGALLLVALLGMGCYTPRYAPVTPVVLRLASRSGFRISFPAGPDAPASSCLALRGRLDLTELRGDTLHFSRVIDVQQPHDAAPCASSGPGFVVVSAHADLKSRQPGFNGALTLILLAPLVILISAGLSGPLVNGL